MSTHYSFQTAVLRVATLRGPSVKLGHAFVRLASLHFGVVLERPHAVLVGLQLDLGLALAKHLADGEQKRVHSHRLPSARREQLRAHRTADGDMAPQQWFAIAPIHVTKSTGASAEPIVQQQPSPPPPIEIPPTRVEHFNGFMSDDDAFAEALRRSVEAVPPSPVLKSTAACAPVDTNAHAELPFDDAPIELCCARASTLFSGQNGNGKYALDAQDENGFENAS